MTDLEMLQELVELKAERKVMQGLVDFILDNSRLDYTGNSLRLNDKADGVLVMVKAFFWEEYQERLNQLKAEAEEAEKKAEKILAEINDAEEGSDNG